MTSYNIRIIDTTCQHNDDDNDEDDNDNDTPHLAPLSLWCLVTIANGRDKNDGVEEGSWEPDNVLWIKKGLPGKVHFLLVSSS